MAIEALIDEVIGREGGYSNHPADKGGPTRWGVTEAVARAHGYGGNMRAFPRDEAVAIYRKLYWQRPGFDRVEALAGLRLSCLIPASIWDPRPRQGFCAARSMRSTAMARIIQISAVRR
jgi:Glycosyl hydrolase 108